MIAAALCAFALGSCGSSPPDSAPDTATAPGQRLPLATEEKRLQQRRLVSSSDLRGARPGTVQRAFYDYWSSLENEEWTIALDYYPLETQRLLKPPSLISALRYEAQSLPVKPLIRGVRNARADQTSVRYLLRRGDGTLRPTSMIWVKRDGRWYIRYSSTLDDSYASAARQLAQSASDPNGAAPSKQALAAAARASRAQASALRP